MELQKRRFRIDKLEERIAPVHLAIQIAVPEAAAAAAEVHGQDNLPHSGGKFVFTDSGRPGRMLE